MTDELTFRRSTDTRTEAHHGQILIARFKKSSRLLAAHPERDLSTTNSGAASEKDHCHFFAALHGAMFLSQSTSEDKLVSITVIQI